MLATLAIGCVCLAAFVWVFYNFSMSQTLQKGNDCVHFFVGDAEQFDDLTMLCLEYRGQTIKSDVKEKPDNAN